LRALSLLLAAALAPAGAVAQTREEPLWELGIGVAGLAFPHYRGSDQARGYVLPAPYVVYRGEFLKADRHGVRGLLFGRDNLDLNLSFGASLPVDSSENRAREGMPDLKPSVEMGASLDWTLWESQARGLKLDLRMPLRGVITIESSPRYIGYQFYPHLNIDVDAPGGMSGWNLGMLAGPVYTDTKYNKYFYEVAPEFATPTRPAYTPGGGYAGTQFILAMSKRFPKYWIGGFVRFDTLNGAAFEDSALVTSKRYAAAGIAISWIFNESKQRVTVDKFDERQ
jgi:MipA family protein